MFTTTHRAGARIALIGAALALVFAACGDTSEPQQAAAPLAVQDVQEAPVADLPVAAPDPAPSSVARIDATTAPAATTDPAPSQTPTSVFENRASAESTTTTTLPASTAATAPAATAVRYTADPVYGVPPYPGSNGAAGSGCAPGAGPLPDGAWFGSVADRDDASIDFDLACFYFGEAADAVCSEDGEPVDDSYCITNSNPTLRTVSVAANTPVHALVAGAVVEVMPFVGWPPADQYQACPTEFCLVWLFVNDGMVTEIMEAYTP